MNVVDQLLVRVGRLPDEHRLGYRLRLAALNGLRDAGWLPALDAQHDDDVSIRTWRFARHCPACLRDSPIWRDEWTLAHIPLCSRHSAWLVDTCRACGRHLRWRRMRLTHCGCGADLRMRKTVGVPHQVGEVLRAMVDGANAESTGASTTARLSAPQFARLVLALAAPIALRGQARPRQKACRSDLKQCRRILIAAARLLTEWPRAFNAHLQQLLRQQTISAPPPLARAFGQVYRPLYRELAAPEYQFLRVAFERFVERRWPVPLNGRNRGVRANVQPAAQVLPLSRAARAAGVRTETFLRRCRAARINVRARQPRQGTRLQYLIAKDSLKRLAAMSTDQISVRKASRMLGIGCGRVRELRGAGRLTEDEQAPSCAGVSEIAVRKLIGQIATASRCGPIPGGVALELRHALQFLIPLGRFVPLVESILNQSIPVFAAEPPTTMGRLLLLREDVVRHVGRGSAASALSVPEAARALGIKQEVAYALVRSGHLKTVRNRRGMRTSEAITKTGLMRFSRRYVSAMELARLKGTSPRAMIETLRKRRVRPMVGPGTDSCRQAFFLRATILRVTGSLPLTPVSIKRA